MNWNEDSSRQAGKSETLAHDAAVPMRASVTESGGGSATDADALMQTLAVVARHGATSVVLVTQDLRILSALGTFFNPDGSGIAAVGVDMRVVAEHLNDQILEADLAAAFERSAQPARMLIAPTGQWLCRTIDMVDGTLARALVSYRDVTVDRHHGLLMDGQRLILDALARHERPEAIFQTFARMIETNSAPGVHASVLWLQNGGRRLRHLASPSLPKAYIDTIDAIAIGPEAGTCGAAAYRRRRVVTEDIASDPLWTDSRDTALAAGLRACWAQPVFGTDGGVLGAFALYRDSPGAPSAAELHMLEMAVQTASIAMSDLRAKDETQFQAALFDNLQQAVVATDNDRRVRRWSVGAELLLGYSAEDVLGRSLDSILELSNGFATVEQQGTWNGEITVLDKNAPPLTVEVSLAEVADRNRGRRGFVGILRDVTQRRAAEHRLVAQSRRHRAVAYLGRIALGDCDMQSLMDQTVELLANVLDVPLCKVLELDAAGRSLRMRAGVGWSEGLVGTARVDAGGASQAGYTLLSAHPVVVEDLSTETRFSGPPLLIRHGVVSGMSVVILGAGEQAYGVLGVHSRDRRSFTEADVNFLQSVANLLSQSIRRSTDIDQQKRTEHQLIEQARRLEMINWIKTTLAAELDLETLVQRVIDVSTKLCGADFGIYLQRIDEAPGYALVAASGAVPEGFDARSMPCVGQIFGDGATGVIRCDDNQASSEDIPMRGCLAVPLISGTGALLGGIFVGQLKPTSFDVDDEQLIAELGTQSAIAIDNARLYRALRESKDQARQQLEHINAIYATAPVGLCYIDRDLRAVSMNVHLRALVGASNTEVNGQPLDGVLGAAAAAIEPLCRKLLDGRRPIFDWEISWRSDEQGELHYWLCGGYPILDETGEVQGINTVVRDITARKHAELELVRLGDIVNSSYDAIIGKTLDGIITDWNRGAERVYGYTAEEAIGQSISIILPDNRRREGSEILAALREGTYLQLAEVERIRKDGELILVAMTVSPIRDASGVIIGASTIGRDITAQKHAEQAIRASEARMHFILQATKVGTWEWDVRTNKVHWSDSLEELHGRPRGSFQGTFESVLADVYPEDKALIDAAVADALNGTGDYHVEYRIVTSDGGTRWVEGKGQMTYDANGKPERMAGICMDVTERKEAEQALRTSETLLRCQTEELATAHRQKDEFLAMLAHELRNPLAPISNSVQLLKIQEPEQREQSLPWAIDVIDRQVGQISRLVDDLLDVARITRGRIELQPEYINLNEVISRAAEAAAPWFEAKQQNFEVYYTTHPVPVLVDVARMIQVVSNLLNNASKFTAERGTVRLRLQRDRDEALISVDDTGTGISPDILPHVFELFTQGDRSLDRRQGGLGLGLPLVRRLVEMHEGRVVAISPGMGRGSEFVIHLPIALAADASVQDAPEERRDDDAQRPIRILVVDDNAQSADAMAVLLETLGHQVTAAYNGPTAVCIAGEIQPELVFLDIGLPLMDGYEVAEALRQQHGDKIRLIALSGYAPRHAETHLGHRPFDHYILKPISFDKLTSILADYAGTRPCAG